MTTACYLLKLVSILKKCFEKPDVHESKDNIWAYTYESISSQTLRLEKSHKHAWKHPLNFRVRQVDKKKKM